MPDIDTVAWQRLPHLLHLHLAHYVVIAELGHQYGFVSELALRHRPHLLDPPDHRQRALRPCVSVLYSSLYSTKTRCHEFPVGAAQKNRAACRSSTGPGHSLAVHHEQVRTTNLRELRRS